ncbi:Na+/H+ antiporter NhaA [Cryptosporangium aurantiacum]|uniref:Na(+)/H(+) antiporter NhaA n=1 Tax=Cryptosporangium aurantiacum TaxID=134849 RepID=A0A1M7KVI9_9ACTN|nr:Na+/H+ antiporter NhaA [Cryptosporangium aurantiacum]SHM69068.1 sodium/proton antiporter, NhaA family [Cryptosporangium aurantiacum]
MSNSLPLPGRPGPASRIGLPYLSPAVREFLTREAGSAGVLLAATVAALVWANLPGDSYEAFWTITTDVRVGSWALNLDLRHVVNDAAMSVFFAVVGLEISREITIGELRDRRTVIVPALGALGGLALPALIYMAFQHSGPAAAGWGIPMSTDTAFLVGVLALFGPRCPDQLRLFLLTLAIVDDIGAITVMAVFYSDGISVDALLVSALLVAALIGLRVARVWRLTPYVLVGIALWVAVHDSGVHPTLAGALLGLIVPAAAVDPTHRQRLAYYGSAVIEAATPERVRLANAAARATLSTNERLQDALHPVSALVILPLFGLANAGVPLDWATLKDASTSSVTIGVVVALVVGNAVGISLTAGIALRTGLGSLPGRVRYGHLIGGAVLAGIGFTIALFITDLAFDDEALRQQAKIGVLTGSLLAAVLGSLLLRYLGERLPLCSVDGPEGPPPLPSGPWIDPTLVAARVRRE